MGSLVRHENGNANTAPATVNAVTATVMHESDTSLQHYVHDVAEGYISGNSVFYLLCCVKRCAFFPLPLPHPYFGLRILMFKKSFRFGCVTAAFLSVFVVHSTFAVDEKIETIYISATRSEGPQMPVATQITVIDAEQIRISGATTITEVLRTQAGIQIQDADGSGGRNVTVAMRGFSVTAANNTLILVDGRRLNNPSLAGPALNTVALKDIERVEIIQGSAGVLYGDQAVGGVINVITRSAQSGEIKGSIGVEKGTDNLENYTARVNQGFSSGLNYSVSAQKRNADNFRDNNQSASTNVLGNIGFDFDAGEIFIEQQVIKDDLRLAGSLLDSEVMVNPRNTNSPMDFSNQDTDLKRIGGSVELLKGWQLLGEYADRDENTDGYFYGNFTQNMRVKNATPRVVGHIATRNGVSVLTVGYDTTQSFYKATTFSQPDYQQDVDGYYGQVIYPATPRVSVIGGVRHSSVEDTNKKGNTHRSDSVNAGEIGVNFQIDSAWRVFARSAGGFRFANADENGFALPGIDFLNVQTSQSQEGGVAWVEKTASVKYSIYNMAIDNEITYDPIAGRNINLPTSKRQGFMFDGDVQLSEEIGLRGNYTYTNASSTSGDLNGKAVPFVAKNSANIGMIFTIAHGVVTSFDANYTGSRFRADDYDNASSKIDALTLFNFNIIWSIDDVELGIRVKNITSEKYSDYDGIYGQYPQPSRTYNARVSYHF